MTDTLLSSVAILRTNWDIRQRSFVDNFLPFVADTMLAMREEKYSARQLQAGVADRFKITMPVGAVETVLKRAAREGLGIRDHGYLLVDRQKLERYDLSGVRDRVLRQHRSLVAKLRSFAENEHQHQLTTNEAEAALLAFIDQHAVSIAESARTGRPYQASLGLDRPTDYLVSLFIVDVFERDPDSFEYLDQLVKGSMLASALYLPNVAEVGRKFERTTLYFDTPILLRALGYAGQAAQDAARQMIDSAYSLGAGLACFEDTVVEIRGVLHGVSAGLRRPHASAAVRREVDQFFVDSGKTPSDVSLLLEQLNQDLAALRVVVNPRPEHVASLTVDEGQLGERLKELGHYQSDVALRHDLDVLTAIHRLRHGGKKPDLESCRALFVTTNAALVRVARELFGLEDQSAWPLVMLDHDIATLIWLKSPTRAPDLPRKQLIADCYAALKPSQHLWARYLAEIESLRERGAITEDDYYLLRYSSVATQALMHETKADADKADRHTVDLVLQQINQRLEKPWVVKVQATKESGAAKHAEALRRAKLAEDALQNSRAEFENFKSKLRRDIHVAASKWGRRARRATGAALGTLALVFVWFSLPAGVLVAPSLGTVQWATRVALVIGALLSFVCWITGWSVKAMANHVELVVAATIERWLLSRRHLDFDAGPQAGHPSDADTGGDASIDLPRSSATVIQEFEKGGDGDADGQEGRYRSVKGVARPKVEQGRQDNGRERPGTAATQDRQQ